MASWCVFEHSSNCPNPLDSSHLLYTPNGTHTASKPLTNGASLTNGVSKEETMNAWCVVEHAKEIQRVTRPMPQPKGTEVVIKVTHCGVCHSDLHFWEGFYELGGGKRFYIADRGVKLPRAVGHEILGDVVKVGPDVRGLNIGDRRIVYPWIGCGTCRRCKQGDDNMCGAQQSLGVMHDGGFAEYVTVREPKYLVDPGDLDPAVACTFSCSGITVLSAIRKVMPLEPDDAILLIGAGGLGLSAISMLRALGHRKIISVDISPEKRDGAMKAGATAVVDGKQKEAPQEVLKAAGGPVLAVLDFVNGSQTSTMAYGALAKGGKMVCVGVMGGELNLSLVSMIFKAATILGNNTGNLANLQEVTKLAREGKLAPIPTTTLPRSEAHKALMRLRDGQVAGRLVLTNG